ncbi:MAG: hypothetical protein ACRDG7_00620 [Candidatus Limnocylindria bacterium]
MASFGDGKIEAYPRSSCSTISARAGVSPGSGVGKRRRRAAQLAANVILFDEHLDPHPASEHRGSPGRWSALQEVDLPARVLFAPDHTPELEIVKQVA